MVSCLVVCLWLEDANTTTSRHFTPMHNNPNWSLRLTEFISQKLFAFDSSSKTAGKSKGHTLRHMIHTVLVSGTNITIIHAQNDPIIAFANSQRLVCDFAIR